MTKSYVVCGVGCRRREEPLVVPAGVQIVFYRTQARPPQTTGVRTPLDELMVAAKLFPAAVAGPGDSIAAAFCWARGTGTPSSGVYRRSTGRQVMALSDTGPDRPVALAYIVRELTRHRAGGLTIIHWLTEPAEVEPMSSSWTLQQPPRLYMRDVGASEEAGVADGSPAGPPENAPSDEAVPPGWFTVKLGS